MRKWNAAVGVVNGRKPSKWKNRGSQTWKPPFLCPSDSLPSNSKPALSPCDEAQARKRGRQLRKRKAASDHPTRPPPCSPQPKQIKKPAVGRRSRGGGNRKRSESVRAEQACLLRLRLPESPSPPLPPMDQLVNFIIRPPRWELPPDSGVLGLDLGRAAPRRLGGSPVGLVDGCRCLARAALPGGWFERSELYGRSGESNRIRWWQSSVWLRGRAIELWSVVGLRFTRDSGGMRVCVCVCTRD